MKYSSVIITPTVLNNGGVDTHTSHIPYLSSCQLMIQDCMIRSVIFYDTEHLCSGRFNNSFSPPSTPDTFNCQWFFFTQYCTGHYLVCGDTCQWCVLDSGILPWHELIRSLLAGGIEWALYKFSWCLWVADLKEAPVQSVFNQQWRLNLL